MAMGGKAAEDAKIQADVDAFNNAVSLRHLEEDKGFDIREDMTKDELRKPLEFLKVPPKPEEY